MGAAKSTASRDFVQRNFNLDRLLVAEIERRAHENDRSVSAELRDTLSRVYGLQSTPSKR